MHLVWFPCISCMEFRPPWSDFHRLAWKSDSSIPAWCGSDGSEGTERTERMFRKNIVGFPNWHVSGCHFQEQVGWGSGLEKHNWHLKTLFMADIFLWSDIFSRIPINPSSKGASGWLICLLTFLYWTTGDDQLENHPFTCTKFLKYLEWFLECSKKINKENPLKKRSTK